jgi:hypothetical protein
MSHRIGRGLGLGAVAVVACLTLSGCFGSGSSEPSSTPPPTSQQTSGTPTETPSTGDTTPTSPPTSAPTSAPTTGTTTGTSATLSVDPPSNGKHSHSCNVVTGTAPTDFVYYPVLIKTSAPATLDSATITYADGVQEKGSWIAPATSLQGTGTVEGWPAPAILAQGSSVQWSKRVDASGAALDPATGWYNVFLRLRVYPDQLPYHTQGIVFTFHDTAGQHTMTWGDHVTFAASC